MKFTQELGTGSYRIRSYQPGQVQVNDELIGTSVVVMADALLRDWPPAEVVELTTAHFEPVIAMRPELVILGTGERQRFPDRAILRELILKGVGVEVMDTAAACRTYNILMAEDRRVAAALLLR